MTHFNSEEWKTLGQGMEKERDRIMEDHLLNCDACLQLFLEGIDDDVLAEAEKLIPSGFTAQTSALIMADERRKEKYPARFQRKGFLAYYAAAAAITIMLTGGGVFQALNEAARTNVPAHSAVQAGSKYEAILFNWPSRLQEKTVDWFNAIELKNIRRLNSEEEK